jgi:hypothetical protein
MLSFLAQIPFNKIKHVHVMTHDDKHMYMMFGTGHDHVRPAGSLIGSPENRMKVICLGTVEGQG